MRLWAGFFGKTPANGDFVCEGIPLAARRDLDAWLTNELLPAGGALPAAGIRALLQLGTDTCAVLAVASRDAAGRSFPLAAATNVWRRPATADRWCADMLPWLAAAVADGADLPEIAVAGQDVESGEAGLVWVKGQEPIAATPRNIRRLVCKISSD